MSFKHKLIGSWHRFLQTNFNVFLRSAPLIGKERKFAHIDVQNQFEQYEKERKQTRLQLIEYKQQLRKKILESELKLISETKTVDFIGEDRFQVTENTQLNQELLKRIMMDKDQIEFDGKDRKAIITQQIIEIENQLKKISEEKKELELVQEQILELEPDMVILQGPEKKIVLNLIHYYEFQQRNIANIFLNPETKKQMEIVHYHVQNNLPVHRERLYEVVPELFESEIGELEEYKQKLIQQRRPLLITDTESIIQIVTQRASDKEQKNITFYEKLKNEEMEMSDFVYKKAIEFCDKHEDYIELRQAQGIQNVEEIFNVLLMKVEFTDQEVKVLDDYKKLKKINDDYNELIELNRVRVFNHQRELHIPEFVRQHETLRLAWTQKWETIIKNSFDFQDSYLVPSNSYESKLDHVITEQRKHDIQKLIEQSQNEYKQQVLGDEIPLRKTDRRNKDESLVKKVQIMADLMHSLPTDSEMKQITAKKNQQQVKQEDPLISYRSEEQRIMVSELPKILFLNNQNPEKYNLIFWAKHFNIEPQKLKNIFNYISYPIISADSNKETSRILRFVQFTK